MQYVAFRGRDDGHVYELARDLSGGAGGQITVTDVTGPAVAVSDPAYLVDGSTAALVYWGVDDHQYLAVNADGAWQRALDVNNGTGAAAASGNAALYASGGDVHVVGRAGDAGHLADATLKGAWQSGSAWSRAADDATAAAGAPAATYQPATYTDADGSVHIVFRALRGEIHQIDDGADGRPALAASGRRADVRGQSGRVLPRRRRARPLPRGRTACCRRSSATGRAAGRTVRFPARRRRPTRRSRSSRTAAGLRRSSSSAPATAFSTKRC